MKGDYVKIVVRVASASGFVENKVQAMTDGSKVAVAMPSRNETFITVEELNKADRPVRTARFLATEVLSIVEGHEMLVRAKKK